MLMIRFQRIGRTNDPAFRIVLLEKARAAKDGNITEQLGTYNPKSKDFSIDAEKVKSWIAKGAQPTDSIKNLLITKGILEGKKINVLSKKTPIKKEKIEEKIEEKVVPVEPVETESSPTEEAVPVDEAVSAVEEVSS